MASKAKKEKPLKIAIGDQILLDVARFDLGLNVPARLNEFVSHQVRVSALKSYGFIYRVGEGYRLTEQGLAYLKRTFPKQDFSLKNRVKNEHKISQ